MCSSSVARITTFACRSCGRFAPKVAKSQLLRAATQVRSTAPDLISTTLASIAFSTLSQTCGQGIACKVFCARAPSELVLRAAYLALQRRASRFTDATVFEHSGDQAFFERNGLIGRSE